MVYSKINGGLCSYIANVCLMTIAELCKISAFQTAYQICENVSRMRQIHKPSDGQTLKHIFYLLIKELVWLINRCE